MHPARRLWTLVEPFHAVVYFASQVREAMEVAGYRGFWRGYFAARAAPLGPVGPGPVTAAFYGFAPVFVARAVPDIWDMAPPDAAIAARLDGVDGALRAAGADPPDACARAVEVLVPLVDRCAVPGRPMFAANAALDRPAEPHLDLWHLCTLLREHRGDGHVAATMEAGLGPCDAHAHRVACDGASPDTIRPHRGWSEDDWADATDRLRARGWLDASGAATPDGRAARDVIEARTDDLAAPVLDVDAAADILAPIVAPLVEHLIPYPNAMGVPQP